MARAFQDDPRTAPRSEAQPAQPLTAGLLRTVFLDLFGRPPLPAEAERWEGRALQELIEAELGGEAFWRHWYEEQLYYFLLIDAFRPASEGALAIVPELTDGVLTVKDALHRIALSPSFDLRNPGADTFVTVVLEQITGRTVQAERGELEIGKTLYDGGTGTFLGRRGQGQSDVLRIAIESPDAMRELLARDYRRLLHAEPQPRELKRWTSALAREPGGYLALVRNWLLSPAYAERQERREPLPNRFFVRALHVDLCARLPEEDQARAMRAALDGLADSRPLRAVLARLLLDSGQAAVPDKDDVESPTRWIASLFERLLGRPAQPEELACFVTVFQRPECRPETVLYALLSSPEYHRY